MRNEPLGRQADADRVIDRIDRLPGSPAVPDLPAPDPLRWREFESQRQARLGAVHAAFALLLERPQVERRLLAEASDLALIVSAGLVTAPFPFEQDSRLTTVREALRAIRDAEAGALTALFDRDWYVARNPEAASGNPLVHFALRGARNGRDPSPLFSLAWYGRQATDAAQAVLNPLAHYLWFGAAAGRDPHPLFWGSWYLERNPDVAQLETNPCEHFLAQGWRQGRDPNPWMDIDWYIDTYKDRVHPNPLIDYLLAGAAAGRNPGPGFDTSWYLGAYAEVAERGLNPLVHYVIEGQAKGYAPLPPAPAARRLGVLGRRPGIDWVLMADNHGWAYGNNARRLIQRLPDYDHVFDRHERGQDIAFYFDIRVFEKVGRLGAANVLRVGGQRPIALRYGDDRAALGKDLAVFDAVIVLNQRLHDLIAPLHPSVHLIPNGIDTDAWRPVARKPRRRFTVGFAGNLSTSKERQVKGYDLVEEACTRLGVPLLAMRKGDGQVPHELMPEAFYAKVDCLVLPVGPGKEGSSNVIMEALATGVPVVTTRDCGYHAEHLVDGESVLYCDRSAEGVAAAIERLRDDKALRRRLSENGRAFAVEHHAMDRIGRAYKQVLDRVAATRFGISASFVPLWLPVEDFASSRLRGLTPAKLLNETPVARAALGYDADADVVVISQLASDAVLQAVLANRQQFVIYDVCDRYHVDERLIAEVHARTRFFELVARADLVVCSTPGLKQEIAGLATGRPVAYLPDGLDYMEMLNPEATPPGGPVAWFGNPGRGNFEVGALGARHRAQDEAAGAADHAAALFREGDRLQGYVRRLAARQLRVRAAPGEPVRRDACGGRAAEERQPADHGGRQRRADDRLRIALLRRPARSCRLPRRHRLYRGGGGDQRQAAGEAGGARALSRPGAGIRHRPIRARGDDGPLRFLADRAGLQEAPVTPARRLREP